jgi:hypothetical protein
VLFEIDEIFTKYIILYDLYDLKKYNVILT